MAPLSHITKHFNATLTKSFLLIFLSTLNYGLDNQGFNTSQAMQAFKKQFGHFDKETKLYALETYWISLFNSLNYIGFAVGVIGGSLISARWGRRMCIFVMSCWALVAGTICVSSSSADQILAGRVLFYIYIGMELAVMPVFMSEIMPAPIRGITVGSYQFSLVCGLYLSLPVSCSPRTESKRPAPTFRSSEQEPLVTTRFRPNSKIYNIALRNNPAQGKAKEIFKAPHRKRIAIVIGMNTFQQVTGQAFVSTYSAVFISGLGTINPFNMTVINLSCYLFTMAIGLYLNDRVGRRPLLLLGASIQCAAIMTVGGLGLIHEPSASVKIAIVSLVTVFGCGFILAWAPLTYVVSTEVAPLRLRDVTQRVASCVNVLFQFAVNFSIPYLLYSPYAALGSKVGFIFGSLSFCAIVFTYFSVPECKGKSLEEIDYLFQQGLPIRDFGSHKGAITHYDDNGKIELGKVSFSTVKIEHAE